MHKLKPFLQVTVSNPAEVAKTRLQLQGELVKGGGQKVYKNVVDVFAKTWRNEGVKGLQRGLTPAVRFTLRPKDTFYILHAVYVPSKNQTFVSAALLIKPQILLNGSRLGKHHPLNVYSGNLI